MPLLFSEDIRSIIAGKYLFLDNCFLKELYTNVESLAQYTDLVGGHSFSFIDPFVEIEFRRNTFLPEELKKKEQFVSLDLFLPAVTHVSNFKQIQANALILSKIYTHHDEAKGASLPDLFLAGRVMFMPNKSKVYIITSNTKDFPECVFDVVGTLASRQHDGTLLTFGILSFNEDNFTKAYQRLENLSNR